MCGCANVGPRLLFKVGPSRGGDPPTFFGPAEGGEIIFWVFFMGKIIWVPGGGGYPRPPPPPWVGPGRTPPRVLKRSLVGGNVPM